LVALALIALLAFTFARHQPAQSAGQTLHATPTAAPARPSPERSLETADAPVALVQPHTAGVHTPAAPALDPEEALAYDEMHAPSQPPPPLPLSRAERQLAWAADGPYPGERQLLNPVIRNAKFEEDAAEFAEFFAEPENVTLAANELPHAQGEKR
jgi:hypothetical protein